MTATLASSVLVAISFQAFSAHWSAGKRWFFAVFFLLLIMVEFDVTSIGSWFIRRAPLEVYNFIKADKTDFAVLELPQSYTKSGDQSLFAQYYMLFQPIYEKPMVLGFPTRYLASSLRFTEETSAIFELTHPSSLLNLKTNPSLRPRAKQLEQTGRKILSENGIKYVIFHPDLCASKKPICDEMKTWLDKLLGNPLMEDSAGTLLYKTLDSARI